jgi:hypothetical protein
MTIRGISGGSVAANSVAGRKETPTGPCVGFVDEPPDHTINLTSFFNYLSLVVESPQDTTLVISGPGGSWCNDDFRAKILVWQVSGSLGLIESGWVLTTKTTITLTSSE